jgi:hypothetical protein
VANLKQIAGGAALVLCGAILALSCSSTKVRRVPVAGEAGEGGAAGEAPTPTPTGGTGAVAGGGAAGAADAGAATVSGAGGEPGAAGAANDAAGAGGESGAAPSGLLLYNTGVDSSGVALAGGSVDPHYTLLQSADTTYTGPDAIVTTDIAEGYWVPQSATSKWIAPTANQSYPGATPCDASGTYVWRTTFDLSGRDPSTFKIAGSWGADNSGVDIRLNGVGLGIAAGGYTPLTKFTIEAGFVAGTNTLDFEVLDLGCPNGLRVELTDATNP